MLAESKVLVNSRKVQTPSALIAVFKELEQKYAAFARLVNKDGFYANEEGFRVYVEITHPDLWAELRKVGYG